MKVAQGTLDRLQALYDQLNAMLEQSGDRMKNLQDVMLSIWDSSGDRLKTFNESTNTVFRLA
jgi:ABC-type transporter Mla subunit MlaD